MAARPAVPASLEQEQHTLPGLRNGGTRLSDHSTRRHTRCTQSTRSAGRRNGGTRRALSLTLPPHSLHSINAMGLC